jgi:hypothetical protein
MLYTTSAKIIPVVGYILLLTYITYIGYNPIQIFICLGAIAMVQSQDSTVIALDRFIQATRDSGYKGLAFALAELVDNSFEAGASNVNIQLSKEDGEWTIWVSDNGSGMSPSVLGLALQFGGSTRFNSRKGFGRYGMGLPNSSFSQARRVDVYTWPSKSAVWWSYLDVDQIAAGLLKSVPQPKRIKYNPVKQLQNSPTGTLIIWSKCDRLDYKSGNSFVAELHHSLGRIFRFQLWKGKLITINGENLLPVDPLFLRRGDNLTGATSYGPPLKYEISQAQTQVGPEPSTIIVTFTELPIKKWHCYSNREKRILGITKGAGVSIVRSGREIDYGWFFMGKKRKENYDDWWRCEIQFSAELDELFGVTNTKQGIHPTEALRSFLTPDIERVAHDLNSRVRKRYLQVKSKIFDSPARHQAEERDHLLEPPAKVINEGHKFSAYGLSRLPKVIGTKKVVPGLTYRIEHKTLDDDSFFIPLISSRELVILLNEEHPFYERVYASITKDSLSADAKKLYRYLELLLFAAARAECNISDSGGHGWAQNMRQAWGQALATFLE